MILPSAVDQRTREEQLTRAAIRRVIPKEYFEPDARRSWWSLVRVAACAAACIFLLSQLHPTMSSALVWQLPVLVGLWLLYGWILVGAFLIGHDCGHGSFSSERWINNLVGWICMTPLANSFHAWRLTHERHHAFTQLRGHDIDWAGYLVTRAEFESPSEGPPLITRVGYKLPFGIFLWIAWNTVRRASMSHAMFASARLAPYRRRLLRANLAMGVGLVGIYSGLWYGCGFWGMLKYHGIPATFAMVTSWIIITIQHANQHSLWYEPVGWTPVRGQLASTFDIRFPRWLEYLWCDGNIHIPHHVAPTIPWYNLKKAGRAIQQAYPAYYQEQRFTLSHIAWLRKTPLIEKVEEKSYYVFEGTRDAPAIP